MELSIDREKVIKGLECLAQKQAPTANPCKDCGYINRPSFAICVKDIASDALTLLKEQEVKWVEDKQDEHCRLIKCSKCGLTFIVGNNIPYDEWIEDRNYCRRCGARMVKPND